MSVGADRLEMPDGTAFEFVERPADPESEPLVMLFKLAPDCAHPPPHIHPAGQKETFECLEGSFELLVGRDWRPLGAGDSLEVPPGTRHTFRNRGTEVARVRNVHDPAHSFERYIRRVHAIATETGATSGRSPKLMVALSMLWAEHGDTIRAADPPLRFGMALMARVGSLLGMRLPEA